MRNAVTIMKRIIVVTMSLALAVSLAACGAGGEESTARLDISSTAQLSEKAENEETLPENMGEETVSTEDEKEKIDTYVVLNDGATTIKGNGASFRDSTLTIKKAGVYSIKGTLTDGNIFINVDEDKKVKLLLSGVDICSSKTAPVFIENSNKETKLVLMSGTENKLADSSERTSDEDDDDYANATLFSKDDLEICGGGSLDIYAEFGKGIFSKNDVQISSGSINITAVDDGIRGKDSVLISGGEVSISCGGDGVSSDSAIAISGGKLIIKDSYEGLEGADISVSGGFVDITASDDGINAVAEDDDNKSAFKFGGLGENVNTDASFIISGGEIYVDSGGDGVDSNGAVNMTGGLLVIFGPLSNGDTAFDCQTTSTVTGGTLLAVGSGGMVEGIGTASPYISANVTISASTLVTIKDESGKELFAFVTPKEIQNIIFRSADTTDGKTYTIMTGGTHDGESVNGVYTSGQTIGGNRAETATASTSAIVKGGFGGPSGMPAGQPGDPNHDNGGEQG